MRSLFGQFGIGISGGVVAMLGLSVAACGGDDDAGSFDPASSAGEGGTTTTGPSSNGVTEPETTEETTDSSTTGDDNETETVGEPEPLCQPLDQFPAMLDVRRVVVKVTVDGEPFVGSIYDNATISLVNRGSGDRIPLGTVQQGTLEAWVLPGTYDVVYDAVPGVDKLPRNRNATLENLEVEKSFDLDQYPIDIKRVPVVLGLKVNGGSPSPSVHDDGKIFLAEAGEGRREDTQIFLAKTSALSQSPFYLLEGKYDVFYESEDRLEIMPYNALTKIHDQEIEHPVGENPTPVDLAVNIETVTLSGAITFGESEPPKSIYDRGYIFLEDPATSSRTRIADTTHGAITGVPVIKGTTYNLFYAVDRTLELAPANHWARIHDEPVDGETLATVVQALSIETAKVSGTITVDGAVPPVDPHNRGELWVGDGGDRAVIGRIGYGLSATLIKGSYGLFFRHETSDGALPANTFGRLYKELPLAGEQPEPQEIAITTTLLTGTIEIDDKTPPVTIYSDGLLSLRSAAEGSDASDRVLLGRTRHGSYSRRIVDGTYNLYYTMDRTMGSDDVPRNRDWLLSKESIEIKGGKQELHIDIPTYALNTMTPELISTQDEPLGSGNFYLRGLEGGAEILLGSTLDDKLHAFVIPGEYEVIYRVDIRGPGTPMNDGYSLGCFMIGDPPFN